MNAAYSQIGPSPSNNLADDPMAASPHEDVRESLAQRTYEREVCISERKNHMKFGTAGHYKKSSHSSLGLCTGHI